MTAQSQPAVAGEGVGRAVRRLPGPVVLTLLLLLLALVTIIAIGTGPMSIPPMDVLKVISSKVFGTAAPADATATYVVWDLRLPRIILAALVGAALAASGAALQGLFGNPLADPGIVGVTSGASLGAMAVIALNISVLGVWTLPVGAFITGFATTSMIYVLARPGVGGGGMMTLLLVGIALTSMLGAASGMLTYIADERELQTMTYWSMGSFGSAKWSGILAAIPFLVVGLAWLLTKAHALDLLALGEKQARHLGVDIVRTRRTLVFTTALLVAGAVAFAGSIGFVGLVIPHLMRLSVGPGHRWLLPISAAGGALLLVFADIGARTLNPPSEVPIGLFTSLIGGPFFLALIIRSRRNGEVRL